MRVDAYTGAVEAALGVAKALRLRLILRVQDSIDRRTQVVDGRVERERVSRIAGLGLHVFTEDGSVGFASVDEVSPEAAAEAVRRAGLLARASEAMVNRARPDENHGAPWPAASVMPAAVSSHDCTGRWVPSDVPQRLRDAQEALSDLHVGAERSMRSALHRVDEQWRIVRSDGLNVSFDTSRAVFRHDLSGRIEGKATRATAHLAGDGAANLLTDAALQRVALRLRRSAGDARAAAMAPPPAHGAYRLVLNHALAKGLAHEAIGHLCESDVDGSVLMRRGRLRLGERLARETVSIVDGPLPGDYVQQPWSANGIERQTVRLIDRGVLAGGLGDLFSAAQAAVPVTGACRASGYRDRPTPRMTNVRVEMANPLALAADPDSLTADEVLSALRCHGLLEGTVPTLYLAGYRGGQAHPRRGDFVFGAEAVYDLSDGGRPLAAASFSGLAERALAAIRAGIGPLCTDAIGSCGKDGSAVTSSGGSNALLVLDADPDLVISAAP